ncbi:hypothetical protein AAA799B03_01272 [Marine Group I thaumarchaeote SCGC AAA799-B03]|uniref:Uncharacterized protein n=1 Tax=Marine Group I thaumarchaeote SCGC AAA799-B03 TaxID=1502289 RepID=A0A087S644_9ARCH|nr:hypothetical protein AAA799B03_01272 [Marine Group I thaumarchaeote SCGC AAA799-B03]
MFKIKSNLKLIYRIISRQFINFVWQLYIMNEDFAEYTKCTTCGVALLYCDCNCPYCGKREECECEIGALTIP